MAVTPLLGRRISVSYIWLGTLILPSVLVTLDRPLVQGSLLIVNRVCHMNTMDAEPRLHEVICHTEHDTCMSLIVLSNLLTVRPFMEATWTGAGRPKQWLHLGY